MELPLLEARGWGKIPRTPESPTPLDKHKLEPKGIGKRQKQSWQRTEKGRRILCMYLAAKVIAAIVGVLVILSILYYFGSHPWALTHTRVQHGTTKTVRQVCWMVEPRNIWKVWDNNSTANITEKLENLRETLLSNQTQNVTEGSEILYALQDEGPGGVMLRILQLKKKVIRTVGCTWIRADPGEPGWYCSWGCRPLPGVEGQGYWEKEAVFPADDRNDTCLTVLPKWEFWGSYKFNCELSNRPKPRRKIKTIRDPGNTAKSDNSTQGPITTPASLPATPAPGTASPLNPPSQESTVQLLEPGPKTRLSQRQLLMRNLTLTCARKQLTQLDKCYWNVNKPCDTQNYVVVTPAALPWVFVTPVTLPWLSVREGRHKYRPTPTAYHEDWLNDSLPWLWKKPLQHFVGNFQAGYAWTGLGLIGPRQTEMYVQKLPSPDDLAEVPKEDFRRIDLCVAEKIFEALNNTSYVNDGKSPRCPINEVRTRGWGEWIYDCNGTRNNKTVKGVLQSWAETHTRSKDLTWWGLERAEIEQWVMPCLSKSSNYWVKYQYVATVYSKDRDIWPGMWYRPETFVTPRPWKMICNKTNTTCTVSLSRENCEDVPGWKDHCQSYYEGEYDTHGHQTVWQKAKGTWRRVFPPRLGCARSILGHGMSRRKEVRGVTVPFVADPLIFVAEGHAFRKSLCEGREIKGYEWLGPNGLYNNGTCHSPAEHWMHCGAGRQEHECHWYERIGIAIRGTITTVLEETAEIIEEGIEVVTGWVVTLLLKIWPYLLIVIGILIASVIIIVVVKGGVRAAFLSCGRSARVGGPEDEKPLLRKGEELQNP